MTPRLTLISGAYPPALDGIGDYTFHLAGELAKSRPVTVLTGRQPRFEARPDVSVCGVFDPAVRKSVTALPAAVEGGGWVVLQYNPFSFGPRGINPSLVPALAAIRRKTHSRLAVMFHETHVPPRGWKFLVLFAFQYPQFRSIARMADAVFVSSERWTAQVRRAGVLRPVVHLPVGSNVDAPTVRREEARERLGVSGTVLGVFGSAHPSRMMDWIACAAGKLGNATLVYIGKDGATLRRLLDSAVRCVDLGTLAASAVGNALAACDLVLAPFSDGLSTRRGSALAALQCGVPLASTRTVWTDSCLCGQASVFLSEVASGREAYARMVAEAAAAVAKEESLRHGARILYEANFSWPVIARSLVAHLDGL